MGYEEDEALGAKHKRSKGKPITYHNIFAEDGRERLEAIKKKLYKTAAPFIPGRRYCWIFGFTDLGKSVLWGPYTTEAEAETAAIALDKFEIFHLKTVNTATASRAVKAEIIARGGSPDEALQRLMHKHPKSVPTERKRRRWF